MLFDLKGKRRRLVQFTYAALAILMAGGLILFGIGGGVSGGLLNAVTGNSGNGGDSATQSRINQDNRVLRANPTDQPTLLDLTRSYYQLASVQADPNSGQFNPKARPSLHAADGAWQRYLGLSPPKPDDAVAGLMLQAYSELGLNQPVQAAQAAEIVAGTHPSSNSYLVLEHYAALAHQDRKADLAGQQAISLAPPNQVDAVKQYVQQAKQTAAPAPGQGQPPPAPGP